MNLEKNSGAGFGETPTPNIHPQPIVLDRLAREFPDLSNAHFCLLNIGALGVCLIILTIALSSRTTHNFTLILFLICALQGAFYWLGLILFIGQPREITLYEDSESMPKVTILVPLYDEVNILPQLSHALGAIDYPNPKLEILILLEQSDTQTQHAAVQLKWPQTASIVIVPEGRPRTKPRACNYGLGFASGEIIGILDAEDVPHPHLLREVAALLTDKSKPKSVCVQAPLRVIPQSKRLLHHLFAIEYGLQFTFLLPAWIASGAPTPLSGTSNFIKTDVLRAVGGWDSYNLTEDADLGIRLARFGYRVTYAQLPCFECAPERVRDWFFQRTRWYSGHIQTFLVHIRDPLALYWTLGAWSTILFVSAFFTRIFTTVAHLLLIATISFEYDALLSYVTSSPLGAIALIIYVGRFACLSGLALQSDQPYKRLYFLVLPVYWTAQLPALLLAIFNVASRRKHWYKTPHKPHNLAKII